MKDYSDPDAHMVIAAAIAEADKVGIILTENDFGYDEFGDPGLDGMDPFEWIQQVGGY